MAPKKAFPILLAVTLAVAVFGALAYRTASAATVAVQAATSSQASSANLGGSFGKRGGYTDEDLATALGITTDELSAAREQAQAAGLAQAVEAGLITQAQADELQADDSTAHFGGRWNGLLAENGIDYDALLADALGISVEKLQAAYQTAFFAHIDQAVADGSLTQEQADLMKGRYALANDSAFQSAMQTAFEAAVAQAVADGVITQAQADQILAENSGKGFGLRGFDKPGDGMRGPGDGMRGPGGRHHSDHGDTLETPVEPDATTTPTDGSSG